MKVSWSVNENENKAWEVQKLQIFLKQIQVELTSLFVVIDYKTVHWQVFLIKNVLDTHKGLW